MVEITLSEMQNVAPKIAEAVAKPLHQTNKQVSEAVTATRTKAVESLKTIEKTNEAKANNDKQNTDEQQKEALKNAFKGIDNVMNQFNKSISFAVYEDSGELYAQVINNETKEVMKTYPSKEMLEVMNRISKSIGMLIDKQG